MGKVPTISVSQWSAWNSCRRKWYYSYVRRWKSVSNPVQAFGSAWHSAMDVVWRIACKRELQEEWDDPREGAKFHAKNAFDVSWGNLLPSADPDEWLGPNCAHPMLEHYVDLRWDWLTGVDLLGVEDAILVPRGAAALGGRMDKVVRDKDGELWVVDHKTTGLYSREDGVQPRFWEGFLIDAQVDAYLVGAAHHYGPVAGFVVDAAVRHKTRHDLFGMRYYRRDPRALEAFAAEFDVVAREIARGEEAEVHPRNWNACADFAGCPYMPVCLRHPDVSRLPQNPPAYAPKLKMDLRTTEERLGMEPSGGKA